jgi:multimeric flavodoxin WrbA
VEEAIHSASFRLRSPAPAERRSEVGVPYTERRLVQMAEISGGTPYGATTLAGADGKPTPSEIEAEIARHQGRHVSEITRRLVSGRCGTSTMSFRSI